jgi:exonuclease SbcD
MVICHISDLHIGKNINGYSLLEDQEDMLFSKVLKALQEKKPQVLLISGDIYDTYNPSKEAITLYGSFLDAVLKQGIQVIAISGNHDSPVRLSQHKDILTRGGYYVFGDYQGKLDPVILEDEYGPVFFYPLSFVTPEEVSALYPDLPAPRNYDEAIGRILDSLALDTSKRNVLLLHQAVEGAERDPSDSKPLLGKNGESDYVSASRLSAFDYIALGHIHKHYSLLSGKAVYPGALLPYHIHESNDRYMECITLEEKGKCDVESICFVPKRRVEVFRGTTDEILARPDDKENYVYVELTDSKTYPTLFQRLGEKFPFFLGVLRVNDESMKQVEGTYDPSSSVETTITGFYKEKTGKDMPKEEKDYVLSLLEKLGRKERE